MHPSLISQFLEKTTQVVVAARHLHTDKDKKGGCLCITDHFGRKHITVSIGEVFAIEKAQKYWELCQEKATRLVSNPRHVSSWQSQNESEGKYAGAVRVRDLILSFSGFPALWDEACMLAVGHNIGLSLINREAVEHIRHLSDNPHVWELIDSTKKEPGHTIM